MNRLKGKKQIELLFSKGQKINHFPLSLILLESNQLSFGVSVGKRNFKLAVDRNRIKRMLRVVLNQHLVAVFEDSKKTFSVMLLYTGSNTPDWNLLDKKAISLVEKLKKTL